MQLRLVRAAVAVAFGACLAFAAADGSPSFAVQKSAKKKKGADAKPDDGPIDPIGRPKQFDKGQDDRYALYFEDGAWHVRVTSPKRKGPSAAFGGSVEVVGGKVVAGDFHGLEKAKKAKDADWVFLAANRTGFEFRFVTAGGVDALNFRPSKDATEVRFKLLIDGDDNPKRIFIGAAGRHPEKATFTFPANPEAPAGTGGAEKK